MQLQLAQVTARLEEVLEQFVPPCFALETGDEIWVLLGLLGKVGVCGVGWAISGGPGLSCDQYTTTVQPTGLRKN